MEIITLRSRKIRFIAAAQMFIVIALVLSLLAACASNSTSRTGKGAATGAAIGAGIGLLVGVLSGDARKAVAATAIGAGIGAGQGAYEGWKQDQDDIRTKQITDAIQEAKQSGGQQPSGDVESRARDELTRFIGIWAMEGWVEESGQGRLNVQARVNADIQMSYFVELAYIDLKVTGMDQQVWGTSTIGYDKNEGYNISTRFNTLPESMRATGGTFDQNSRSFTFKGSNYRLIVRFQTPDRFTVETFATSGGSEQQVESYTFTRT